MIDLIPKILTINTDKEHTLENAKTLEKRTDIIKALFLKLSSQDFEVKSYIILLSYFKGSRQCILCLNWNNARKI